MAIFIGIECIGMRYSFAVASDQSGKLLSQARIPRGVSLHTTPREVLRPRLTRLLSGVALGAGRDLDSLTDATVCIGLTGVTFPYDGAVDLPGEFVKLDINIQALTCTGDAEIVFVSHTQGDKGTVVLCHMGSTAYVANTGRRVRFGGWGPALGDEGSGYWMGRAALRAIGEEYDGHRPESILWHEIDRWLSDPEDPVREWTRGSAIWKTYSRGIGQAGNFDIRTVVFAFSHRLSLTDGWLWRTVASGLVIPLMRAWRKGDPAASAIVESASKELCSQHKKACEIAGVPPTLGPLVLYGGVLTHNSDFRQLLVRQLQEQYGESFEPVVPGGPNAMRPVLGALLFALGRSETGNLRLPGQEVIQRVLREQREVGALRND